MRTKSPHALRFTKHSTQKKLFLSLWHKDTAALSSRFYARCTHGFLYDYKRLAGLATITGGAGIDNITGGEGADRLTGAGGIDVYTLTETTSAIDTVVENGSAVDYTDTAGGGTVGATDTVTGMDVIIDFAAGTDILTMAGTLLQYSGAYNALNGIFTIGDGTTVGAGNASTLVFVDGDANGLDDGDLAVVLVGVASLAASPADLNGAAA